MSNSTPCEGGKLFVINETNSSWNPNIFVEWSGLILPKRYPHHLLPTLTEEEIYRVRFIIRWTPKEGVMRAVSAGHLFSTGRTEEFPDHPGAQAAEGTFWLLYNTREEP
jgi:hypothetical protein